MSTARAAKRRKNAAHAVRRGWQEKKEAQAPKGRKKREQVNPTDL
jgi:hypothetical protein